MIKIRTFLILAVVTALVVVAAIVLTTANAPPQTVQGERDYAFPKLVERINNVASIEIRSHDHTFTVSGSGDTWGIVEKNNYRVPREKVRDFLREIANLRLVEGRTERDDRYARLNVDDPKADKSEARGIKVALKDGTVLADWWPHKMKWRIEGVTSTGPHADFLKTLRAVTTLEKQS